jgi:hypothetical protein
MVADSRGESYRAFRSLSEAQAVPDGLVVMEGDYGGQIYLTCPASHVGCDQATLELMLRDLDALSWKELAGAQVFYERGLPGSGVSGGMGGGLIVDDVWIHPELQKLGIEQAVREVISGARKRIGNAPV